MNPDSFASTLLTGREQAQTQLLQITSQVNPAYDDIPEQLSRAQQVYAGKGLTVRQGATDKDIVALSEFQLRNDGRDLQLRAAGERSAEYDIHYAQISGHPSSCPLCAPWQGEIVIDDVFAGGKPNGKTRLMSEAIADGLYHYNCRHERTVYIPGISRPNLYSKDIASLKETATRYTIEQQQRYNERGIREWKLREASALTEQDRMLAAYKVREWQAKQHDLRKIAKQEGVPFYRQYSREQIGGETGPEDKLSSMERTYAGTDKNIIILTKDNVVRETSTGAKIKTVKEHAERRAAGRNVSVGTINRILTSKEAVVETKSKGGKTSENYTLDRITVCINKQDGSIITIYRPAEDIERYKKGGTYKTK